MGKKESRHHPLLEWVRPDPKIKGTGKKGKGARSQKKRVVHWFWPEVEGKKGATDDEDSSSKPKRKTG